jgi:hypothetical protein
LFSHLVAAVDINEGGSEDQNNANAAYHSDHVAVDVTGQQNGNGLSQSHYYRKDNRTCKFLFKIILLI